MARAREQIEQSDKLRRPQAAVSGTVRATRLLGALWREQEGATAVLIAMSLAAFLGAVALSVDLSRAYNLHSQLQQAADAAALAAASQLDNTVGSLDRACEAATGQAAYPCLGPTAGNLTTAIVQNQQQFATDGASGAVTVFQVRFLEQLGTGPGDPDPTSRVYIDTLGIGETEAEARANFVEVTVLPREVAFPFAAAIGAVDSASPDSVAVAGLGEATCKVPPMMICNPDDTIGTNPPFFATDHIGRGVKLDEGGGGSWGPGDFGLLSVDALGKNEIRDAMGRVNPMAQCFGVSVNTSTGEAANIKQGLNVRFNLWEGPHLATKMNDPQYMPSHHSAKGMIKPGAQCDFQPNVNNGWRRPINPFGYIAGLPGGWTQGKGPSDDQTLLIDAMGFPRDNCHYQEDPLDPMSLGSPAGDCAAFRWGDGTWDVKTYMRINHGLNWPITKGPFFGLLDEPARLEVYLEEIASDNIPGVTAAGPTTEVVWPPPGPGQCAPYEDLNPPPVLTPDRRVIAAAVVNCPSVIHDCENGCKAIVGQTNNVVTAVPDGFVGIFLTEPMGTFDSNNALYGEISGPVSGALFATVSRQIVQLYE